MGSDEQKPLSEWPEFVGVAAQVATTEPPVSASVPSPSPIGPKPDSPATRPSQADAKGTEKRPGARWFVRVAGGEQGPLSSQELRRLAEQGVVTQQTDVSADRVTWHAASKVRGLFPNPPPAVAAAEEATTSKAVPPPVPLPPAAPSSIVPSRPTLSAKQLREAIVSYVLHEEPSPSDVPSLVDFHRIHRELTDEAENARERAQQVTAAISAHSPLEKALGQRKKELTTAEVDLGKMAQSLGNAAFNAFLAGKIGQLPVFAERLDLHRKIADLESEKLSLTPPENAGMIQKAKAKAQQMVVFGKIKLAAMSEGSLETAIGNNLLHNNQEESVRCDQTNGILDAICKQRSIIAGHRAQVSEVQTALENKRTALCQSFGLAKIENASTLDAELRKCQTATQQKEKALTDIEQGLPDKLLAEATLPQQGRLAELLADLRRAAACPRYGCPKQGVVQSSTILDSVDPQAGVVSRRLNQSVAPPPVPGVNASSQRAYSAYVSIGGRQFNLVVVGGCFVGMVFLLLFLTWIGWAVVFRTAFNLLAVAALAGAGVFAFRAFSTKTPKARIVSGICAGATSCVCWASWSMASSLSNLAHWLPVSQAPLTSVTLQGSLSESAVLQPDSQQWHGSSLVYEHDTSKNVLRLYTNRHCLMLLDVALAAVQHGGIPDIGDYRLTVTFPTKKSRPVLRIAETPAARDVARIEVSAEGLEEGKDFIVVPTVRDCLKSLAVQPGDEVIAVGTPEEVKFSETRTDGKVSAIRVINEPESGWFGTTWIQHTASITHGNSGGPLFLKKGDAVYWIGINTRQSDQGALRFALSADEATTVDYSWSTASRDGAANLLATVYGIKALANGARPTDQQVATSTPSKAICTPPPSPEKIASFDKLVVKPRTIFLNPHLLKSLLILVWVLLLRLCKVPFPGVKSQPDGLHG
jgi:hypothetical protein